MEHVTAQQGLSGTQAPKPRAKAAWQSRDVSLSRSPLARRWSLRAQSACVMAPVLQDNIQSRARPQTSWKAGVVRAGDQAGPPLIKTCSGPIITAQGPGGDF